MKKILTIVLDGFGINEEQYGNAVKQANMPNYNKFLEEYPHSKLLASEEAVGLPKGQFGNSEVGHMTIGAGRLLKQQETILDELFYKRQIEMNNKFNEMIEYVKYNKSSLHLMILASDGGVHSHIKYLYETLNILKKHEIKNVFIHLISDGRDTSPKEVKTFVNDTLSVIEECKMGSIATLCGRYYAMDRDNKWERTKVYYDLLTIGKGNKPININRFIDACYEKNITDEFIPPALLNSNGLIKDKDAIFIMNFRTDRIRQIGCVLSNPKFSVFPLGKISNIRLYTFYNIDKTVYNINLLDQVPINNPLGRYLSELDLTQARVAETEKFAHVTYFFDGFYKEKIEKCDKYLVNSPNVATYDLKPEMSSREITKKVIECMEKDYDFILVNYASPDMVGHTGNFEATIKALEVIDECLESIIEVAEDNFYTIFLMSDHGNSDIMLDSEGNKVTTHTINPVPFIISDKKIKIKDGTLANVAPTILKYMDIALPIEMQETGNLFVGDDLND